MIHINQIGYLPLAAKRAVITDGAGTFRVVKSDGGGVVFSGDTTAVGYDEISGDTVRHADFSAVTAPGRYRVVTDSGEESYNFDIRGGVYNALKKDMIKALYFQRCGYALDEKHAGVYAHGVCHAEKSAMLGDPSVLLDMTGGWHDAGDYGRYITPAANTIGHLLYAFEFFPAAFTEELNIPESGNGVPDLLNECRWELEWMLKMQDGNSGGVYHKLTTLKHAPFVMPEEDTAQMLVFPFSSMAAGGFAAAMALAYRVYKKYDEPFAQTMLGAAKLAWRWLADNPDFLQAPANPEGGDTGGYWDRSDLDERYWAAAELYRATGDSEYHDAFTALAARDFGKTGFGWEDVSALGTVSYLFNTERALDTAVKDKLAAIFMERAAALYDVHANDKYGTSLLAGEYVWGSNMIVGNNAIHLIIAAILSGDDKYVRAAAAQLDYLLGANPMGISYVTGHGENAYRNPHLRTAYADGIDDPMPGWVSGGPNYMLIDPRAKELFPNGAPPAKCYADDVDCYSLNEMTIYWNSPAIFAAAYFDRG